MTARTRESPQDWSFIPRGPSAGVLLLCYLFWFLNAALGMLTAAELRTSIKLLGMPFRWGPYTFTLVDEVLLLILGLAWLVWVLVMESMYRKAAGRGMAALLRRVARTTGILLAVILLAVAEQKVLGF